MTDNVIQFPYAPNEIEADFDINEMYEQCLNTPVEPQTIRIVLPEPTPPSPAANAAVFLAGFAVMFMVVTVVLS